MDFVRLWLHEASRVYGDKFIDEKDMELFTKLKFNIAKDSFDVREGKLCKCVQLRILDCSI